MKYPIYILLVCCFVMLTSRAYAHPCQGLPQTHRCWIAVEQTLAKNLQTNKDLIAEEALKKLKPSPVGTFDARNFQTRQESLNFMEIAISDEEFDQLKASLLQLEIAGKEEKSYKERDNKYFDVFRKIHGKTNTEIIKFVTEYTLKIKTDCEILKQKGLLNKTESIKSIDQGIIRLQKMIFLKDGDTDFYKRELKRLKKQREKVEKETLETKCP